ncbi:TM vesicle-mediated sorter protein [Novymonas esmeraldas]|uniref:TM vesicle-mediated sorter protein n=1 Tax=Novymonas esmeraldas TaxID=1808958 RepID=A0AAW0F568_9TRYP
MFNKFVADLLTSYLGEYFADIDREQVKVSVWNGLVHMRHLKVRQDALRFLDVPVCVIMGTIEELTIVIPWTRLRSESVVVQLRNAQLVVADKETAGYSIEQDVREARARKLRELAATNEALLQAFRDSMLKTAAAAQADGGAGATTSPGAHAPPSDSAESSDNNFTARLKASILNNIRVEIQQLCVHYTSCVPVTSTADDDAETLPDTTPTSPQSPWQEQQKDGPRHPPSSSSSSPRAGGGGGSSGSSGIAAAPVAGQQASLSFHVAEVRTCGCDARFEPAFVTAGERMARQLLVFRGVAASLRTGPTKESELPFLRPFDVAVELAYQPVYTDTSSPQYMVAGRVEGACACVITSDGCTACYGLAEYLAHVRRRQALRRLRPVGERPGASPRAWWRYTLDAVRQQLQHSRAAALASAHKPTPFSWLAYTSMRQKRDRYARLYLRQQRAALNATGWLEPLTVDEHVEMVALQDELSLDVLKLAQRLAVERVGVERVEYDKLLRQRRAAAAAADSAAASPTTRMPTPTTTTPAPKSAWFSFWRSEPQQQQQLTGAGAGGNGGAADGESEATRAELRELVQLMTAERWTEAQRAVIAKEFGMSAEEAQTLSQSAASASPSPSSDRGPASVLGRSRSVPSWVVFLDAAALTVELQGIASGGTPESTSAAPPSSPAGGARDTLAQVALHSIRAGAEWDGAASAAAAPAAAAVTAAATSLPAAHYWGTMERLVVTAASLDPLSAARGATEQVVLAIGRPDARHGGASDGALSHRAGRAGAVPARPMRSRTFCPLESCWSILPDECRRTAAVQVEWTLRSPSQMRSGAAALHLVRVGLAPLHTVIDVVPLRRLSDFLFTVLWPEPASAHPGAAASDAAHSHDGTPTRETHGGDGNDGDDFTALLLPASARMTQLEQRCAGDAAARLIVLRRKVERQRSIEWCVTVDAVRVSLSEVPQTQGCELALTHVCVRNDVAHRLQRQARLREEEAEGAEGAAGALGSLDADWVDHTHVHAASVRLSVLFPTAGATPSVERAVVLPDTALTAVVDRSMLGRCHPTLPQWHLRLHSDEAVAVTWSRTSLSVLSTACTLLTDLAASVGTTLLQRGATPAASATQGSSADLVETFHLHVRLHPTGRRCWRGVSAADGEAAEGSDHDEPPRSQDARAARHKRLHPFSIARPRAADCGPSSRRVEVRRGVCIVHHEQRHTFPAQYYTLQRGCTRVRRSGTDAASLVHLYIMQGGRDHEEALADGYGEAMRLLRETVGVPPALLENAVWLERVVHAWLDTAAAGQEDGGEGGEPLRQRVRAALRRALMGTQAVPCHYVSFQCASYAEADAVAAALRRCCVAAGTPPLLLRPSVQARYDAAVSAEELRRQPLLTATVALPSLRMACEGLEPVPCADDVEAAQPAPHAPRATAVLSLAPFHLRYDRYREKQRYELCVAERVALSAASSAGDSAAPLLEVVSPSEAADSDNSAALALRLVAYRRPAPLPSVRRAAVRVGPSAHARLRAGPALLEWAEAWWDTVGLLTNRLFGEEVVAGYPWWRCDDGAAVCLGMAQAAEAEWCRTRDYGGDALNNLVDVTLPSIQVDVDVEDAPPPPPPLPLPLLRFRALNTSLQWRMTEACNQVQLRAAQPELQWRCCSSPSASEAGTPRPRWVTLMDADASAVGDGAGVLSVDWKVHRPPPMLSLSDWISASDDGEQGRCALGFREQQEVDVELCRVRLLYWHPLLTYLIASVRDGLVPRASAVVERAPCWFSAGVLRCPPLVWRGAEPTAAAAEAAVSMWTSLRKHVCLRSVKVQLPGNMNWIAQATNAASPTPPAPHLCLAVEQLRFTDTMQAPVALDGSPVTSVTAAYTVQMRGVLVSHVQPRADAPFEGRLPGWEVRLSRPAFEARSVWLAGVPCRKSVDVVLLPSQTEPCVLRGATADVAHVLDVVYANFAHPVPLVVEGESLRDGASAPSSLSSSSSLASPLLMAAAEENTWSLRAEGEVSLRIHASSDAHSVTAHPPQRQCLLLWLRGADLSASRSARGELQCVAAVQQMRLGGGAPFGGRDDSDGSAVFELAAADGGATANSRPPTSLSIEYGWRWRGPHVGGAGEAADPACERCVRAVVDACGAVTVTAGAAALTHLRQVLVEDTCLRESLCRYTTSSSATTPHRAGDGDGDPGAAMLDLQLRLREAECRIPCMANPLPPADAPADVWRSSTSAPVLRCAVSRVAVELRRDAGAVRARLRVGRLAHCLLEESGDESGAAAKAIPLVLEQPSQWQAPAASSAPAQRTTTKRVMTEAPRRADASVLEELFGELPTTAAAAASPATPAAPAALELKSTSDGSAAPAREVLCVSVDETAAHVTATVVLQPLWLVAPSVTRAAGVMDGVRTQLQSCAAVLHRRRGSTGTTAGDGAVSVRRTPPARRYTVQLNSGSMTMFVAQHDVELDVAPRSCAGVAEAAVRRAVDTQETLMLAADAVVVAWDSDGTGPPPPVAGARHTVLHLRCISIAALHGTRSRTVLLDRFDVRVQRQPMPRDEVVAALPSAARATGSAEDGGVEEWRLHLDPLQLTLTQTHYTALLRAALQQTSLLTAVMSAAASSAAQSIAATEQHSAPETPSPVAARRRRLLHVHLPTLRLRVIDDGDGDGDTGAAAAAAAAAAPAAAYVALSELNVTVYGGRHAWSPTTPVEDGLSERGALPRLSVTLAGCHLGADDASPTLAIAAAPRGAQAPCSLRVAQDEDSGAYRGAAHVGQITATAEATPMMTWLKLLYAPWVRVAAPTHASSKELLVEQDLWLSEDLVLSEQAPLRVTNRLYSLVHLYANGHIIHLRAGQPGPCILLDEGMTLRIAHATVCMDTAASIDAFVAAGNGSYVVIDRDTCSVVPPPSSSVAGGGGGGGGGAVGVSQATARRPPRWHRFVGDVHLEVRIPEPRAAAGGVPHGHAAGASAQRTLVLYSQMSLCMMTAPSPVTGEDELTTAFDLAHAGVRSEYVTHHHDNNSDHDHGSGGTAAADATHLVSDWAMKVLTTEEKRRRCDRDGDDAATSSHTRTIHVSASTGVEVRVRYSDVVFATRAARHAQAVASRWQTAMRRGVWSSVSASVQRGWNDTGTPAPARPGQSTATTTTTTTAAGEGNPTTPSTAVSVQVPYLSFFVIDDSQDTDVPLFCLRASDINTPQCLLAPPSATVELRFALQLDHYELTRSRWAPLLDPVDVTASLAMRKNITVVDLYDRRGFSRLSLRTGAVKLCLSLEVLRNVRQLLLLRDSFESTGVAALATRRTNSGGSSAGAVAAAATADFHAFRVAQTTGIDVVVRLPEYVEDPHRRSRRGENDDDGDSAAAHAHAHAHTRVLCTGQEWAFSLPRSHGKELPRSHQRIFVQPQQQQQQQQQRVPGVSESRGSGAAVTLAAVGVQRVPMGVCGPLQRYILADVSVSSQSRGQKLVRLRTVVTFVNRLSRPLLHVAANAAGAYDVVGTVPSGAEEGVPVQLLRRRVALAVGGVPVSGAVLPSAALGASATVALGVSYDALPCLAGSVLLCVCSPPEVSQSSAGVARVARLATGKNFEIISGTPDMVYFLLRVQAAASQPADVLRHPALAPLRAVTVTAAAVVTVRNAVGVPITLTLLKQRVQPGTRMGLLDTSPDTTLYTQVSTVAVGVDECYGATEMDPLEDVCIGVSLQQANGCALAQWSAAPQGGSGAATALHRPACVYSPYSRGRCDAQVVLADPSTNATLVLGITYTPQEVVLYCPQWIVNETEMSLQLADMATPHYGDTERCGSPVAGLSGRTVRTATVAPSSTTATAAATAHAPPFLYNSIRADSCSSSSGSGSGSGSGGSTRNGLFVRLWEPAAASGSATNPATGGGWSDWSTQPILVHETAKVQTAVCASHHARGAVWVLSCHVEVGHSAAAHVRGGTRVVSLRPRWVLVNQSPYPLLLTQPSSAGNRPPNWTRVAPPFSATALGTVLADSDTPHPRLSLSIQDDAAHHIQRCRWSSPFAIDAVGEQHVNAIYDTRVPLAEHWPQSSASAAGQQAVHGAVDRLPPLAPEDVEDAGGELFVRREEAKVFSVTAVEHKGCMMCVEVAEAVQPPLVVENRTAYTVRLRQRGARRVTTVFPRRRKAWTWDVPPQAATAKLPAEVELWVVLDGINDTAAAPAAAAASPSALRARAAASCVLNFDPQRVGQQQSGGADAFQRELEVEDAAAGTSSMLFVRVRGAHGASYAVSITTEPTIDAYRTLPFPQLSFALHLASVYALCHIAGERQTDPPDALLLSVAPVDLSFTQGAQVSAAASARDGGGGGGGGGDGGDVQRIQLRFRSFQVDDERASAKERVVVQLVDDKVSGIQVERRLLRTTPILCCSVVALHLTPVEMHLEDSFIAAAMRYHEEVGESWRALWSRTPPDSTTKARHGSSPPWQAELEQQLAAAARHSVECGRSGDQPAPQPRLRSVVPLWNRVMVIQQLQVDPLLVSLSLYRSLGAADDPLWRIAGAASLLVSSTQDSRLQWDAVQRRDVCGTIGRLAGDYRESYLAQMRSQYMRLVNIAGLDTMRSFVSDLLSAYSDEPSDQHRGAGAGRQRRQKPRVPSRPAAGLAVDQAGGGRSGAVVASRRPASTVANAAADDGVDDEDATATTTALLRAPERVVRIGPQRTATVAEVARGGAWDDFLAVAQPAELKAFGGCALGRAIAEMRMTPRHSLRAGDGGGRRLRAAEVVRAVSTGAQPRPLRCSRCIELEALRETRLRRGAASPLPHPTRDGGITWEELAHHLNWYEFADMCTDDEVRAHAPLLRLGAVEPSRNICLLTTS